MRIGVIGAGVAGLAAARELAQAGHEPVVFEQTGEVGGRVATRLVGEFAFDTGATSVVPRGLSIESVMLEQIRSEDLVRVTKPIYTHSMLRVSPGDAGRNSIARYSYRGGNAKLPKLLAQGLDVRLSHPIEKIERPGDGGFALYGEVFDAVIVTCPAPLAAALLEGVSEARQLAQVSYRKCLSILLGFDRELSERPYHALIDPEQRHPLTWLSIESEKAPGYAPEGCTAFVAQLSPQFSAMHFESEDGAIVAATIEFLARLYGKEWDSPKVFDVKRWQFSLPESMAMFDRVNSPKARLLIAGDGTTGGRVEYAYESGVRAARILIQQG
jgi:renalase